jgi:hypothetical protein
MGSSIIGLAVCLILYMTGTDSPQAGTLGMLASLALTPIISAIVPGGRMAEVSRK